MINVSILGVGKVGGHLIKACINKPAINLVQIYNRSQPALRIYGDITKTTTLVSELKPADIYIVALPDDIISTLDLSQLKGLVVHTSGTKSLNILKTPKRGVFYPTQSFTKGQKINFRVAPICIETEFEDDLAILQKLAYIISDNVYELSEEKRQKLHLAAVFTNNFSNRVIGIAHDICKENSIDFKNMQPLIQETLVKALAVTPKVAQTGPALRNDNKTIEKHLNQLEGTTKEVYRILTQSIQENMSVSYKELLNNVKAFIFDVDGVLTNGMVTIFPNGELVRNMNIKDGYALKTAVDAGYPVCIISGGSSEGVRKRLEGLGITEIHLGVHDKIEKYHEILEKFQLKPEEIVYMGDDVPDYPVMALVGVPCSPQDAVQEIKAISKYVSPVKGGEGCVRDILEQVMRVQGKWNGKFYAKFD